MKLVVIKSFNDVLSAHLTKSMLESEGVLCFLQNEHIMGVNPFYNYAVGGVKLAVPSYHLDKAIRVLNERNDDSDDG